MINLPTPLPRRKKLKKKFGKENNSQGKECPLEKNINSNGLNNHCFSVLKENSSNCSEHSRSQFESSKKDCGSRDIKVLNHKAENRGLYIENCDNSKIVNLNKLSLNANANGNLTLGKREKLLTNKNNLIMNFQAGKACNSSDGRQDAHDESVDNIAKDGKQNLASLHVNCLLKENIDESEYETGSSGSGSLRPWQGSFECLEDEQVRAPDYQELEMLSIDKLPKDTMLDRVLRCFEALHVYRNRDTLMANLRDQIGDLNKDGILTTNRNSSFEKNSKRQENNQCLDSTDNWPPDLFFRDFSLEELQFPVSEVGSVCSAADHRKFCNSEHYSSSYDLIPTSDSYDNITTVRENILKDKYQHFNGIDEQLLTPPGQFRSNLDSEEKRSHFCLITESEFKKKYGGDFDETSLKQNVIDKVLQEPTSSNENSLSNLEHLNKAEYFKNLIDDSIQSVDKENCESDEINFLDFNLLSTEKNNLLTHNPTSLTENGFNEISFTDEAKSNIEYDLLEFKENCQLSVSNKSISSSKESLTSSGIPSIPPPINFDTHPLQLNTDNNDSLESNISNMSSTSSMSNISSKGNFESAVESRNKLSQKDFYGTDIYPSKNILLNEFSNNAVPNLNVNEKTLISEFGHKIALVNDSLNENSLSNGSLSKTSSYSDSLNKDSITSFSSNKNSLTITNLQIDGYMMSKVISFSEMKYPSLQISKNNFNNLVQSNSAPSQKMYPDSDSESESEHDNHSEQKSLNSVNDCEILEVCANKREDSFKIEVDLKNHENLKITNLDLNCLKEFANESSEIKMEIGDNYLHKNESNSLTKPKLENKDVIDSERFSTEFSNIISENVFKDVQISNNTINKITNSNLVEKNGSAKINNMVPNTIRSTEKTNLKSGHENYTQNDTDLKLNTFDINVLENMTNSKHSAPTPISQTWINPSKPLKTPPRTYTKPLLSSSYLIREQLTPVLEEDDTQEGEADDTDDTEFIVTDDPVLNVDMDSMFIEKHFHFHESSNSSDDTMDECPSEPSYKSFLENGLEPSLTHPDSDKKLNNDVTLEAAEPFRSHFQDDWSLGSESKFCTELRNLEPEHFVQLLPHLIDNDHSQAKSKNFNVVCCVVFLKCFDLFFSVMIQCTQSKNLV